MKPKKKYKVTFLLDKSNLWFEKQLKNCDFRLNNKYIFKISKNPKNIKNREVRSVLMLFDTSGRKKIATTMIAAKVMPTDSSRVVNAALQPIKSKKIRSNPDLVDFHLCENTPNINQP